MNARDAVHAGRVLKVIEAITQPARFDSIAGNMMDLHSSQLRTILTAMVSEGQLELTEAGKYRVAKRASPTPPAAPAVIEDKAVVAPTDRSAEGLRGAMFEALDLLRSGQITPKEAAARAAVAGQIVKAAEVQLKFEEMCAKGTIPNVGMRRMALATERAEKD